MDILDLQGVKLSRPTPPFSTSTQAASCKDSSEAFPNTSGCYNVPPPGTIGECIYCGALQQPARQNCVIFPNSSRQANNAQLGCGAINIVGRNFMNLQDNISVSPGLTIFPQGVGGELGQDGHLNKSPFSTHTTGTGVNASSFDSPGSMGITHKYYLNSYVELAVNPCHAPHCPNPDLARWLCRIYISNASGMGWRMLCNKTKEYPAGSPPPGNQLLDRLFQIPIGIDRDMIYIFFSLGGAGGCFHTLNNYCLVSNCSGSGDGSSPSPDCWGGQTSTWMRFAIEDYDDNLKVVAKPQISTNNIVFPHNNKQDIITKNSVWKTYSAVFNSFGSAHNSRVGHDSKSLNVWRASGALGNAPVRDEGVPSSPITQFTITSWKTGIRFPARLIIDSHVTTARFTGQVFGGDTVALRGVDWYRVGATFDIQINLVLELQPNHPDWPKPPEWDDDPSLRPFRFLNPNDLTNYSIDDPQDVMVPTGPNGSRVVLAQSWRGVRGPAPYARGPYQFVYHNTNVHDCFGLLRGIGESHGPASYNFIFGEINNQNETELTGPLEQRYQGDVATWKS